MFFMPFSLVFLRIPFCISIYKGGAIIIMVKKKKKLNSSSSSSGVVVRGQGSASHGNVSPCPDVVDMPYSDQQKDNDVLTMKQRMFCDEYLVDMKGTQAAIRAGYSVGCATSQASKMLSMPKLQKYLETKRRKLEIKTEMSAQYVLQNLKDVAERCMSAQPVVNMAGKPVMDENGNPVYRFDSAGANKALELIGKHLGVFNADQSGSASSSKVVLEIQMIREALMQDNEASRLSSGNGSQENGTSI